ncbi:porin [Polynucleobacter victoriensis]|uniref:Outer membrane protein (Porin) n=1 Tax=Polynucleobacter victoriensis TaxID=2049319 RepID=A0A212TB36_9BURK|nr:porin [Polynucleobacter victoriensis]SNC63041.1 Outer membrane protein (porin) [Polynucleobacter victoriensis]
MKKSLIALAALATVATAAQAQSSVTLYGIVDMGVMSSNPHDTAAGKTGSTLATTSGALSTSRWGVRGTEDLGGGLKASFNLESEIAAGTGVAGGSVVASGATTTGVLFHRASNVTLEKSDLGSIQLGRMNRLEYDAVIANDAFGAANFGGAVRVAYIGSGAVPGTGDVRTANAVVLKSANLGGLVLAYQHQFGGQAGDNSYWSGDAVSATYTAGKLQGVASWSQNNNAGGTKNDSVRTFGLNYDFGVVKAYVGHIERVVSNDTDKVKSQYVGLKAPVTAKISAFGQYTKVSNAAAATGDYAAVANNDAKVYAVGVTYAFSPRTTGYAMHGTSQNDGTAKVYVSNLAAGAAAGKDQTATVIGIRHSF